MTGDPYPQLLHTAAQLWNIPPHLIHGTPGRPSRQPNAVKARAAIAWCLLLHWNHTARQAAQTLGVHHTTILRSLTLVDTTDPRLRDLEEQAQWEH